MSGNHSNETAAAGVPDDVTAAGVHNLSVAVQDPTGAVNALKYQWMRVHPATVVACSQDDADPIVQLSRQFHNYRDAAAARKQRAQGDGGTPESLNNRPALLTASGVNIDLCELLPDPPLLSMSVDAMFQDDSSLNANVAAGHKKPRNAPAVDSTRSNLLERVLDYSTQLVSNATLVDFELPELVGVSEKYLCETLPPSLVVERLERINNPAGATYSLPMSVLIVLAKCGANETVGRYILRHLAPAVLRSGSCLLNTVVEIDLKILAKTLIVHCRLEHMGRQELVLLTRVENEHASQAYRELVTCLGEYYFDAKRQGRTT